MSRYFLFGTLLWDDLLRDVAGEDVGVSRATLPGWSVERASAGDWPTLVEGGEATGYLTAALSDGAKARLDWYEVAFDMVPETVAVEGPDGMVDALVYREENGAGGSGEPWSLTDWVARHGARTRIAAAEVMRGLGKVAPAQIAARRGVIQARAQGTMRARETVRPATVGGKGEAAEVEIDRVEYHHEGFHRTEEWFVDHPRFDGTRSGLLGRAICHTTDAATVLPYDPVRNRVLLVEQIRMGALAKGDPRPWMLEPIAGLIDAGESAEEAAIRETVEEAGLEIGAEALRFIGRYYPSPGGLAQVFHSFVALCDLPDGSDGLHGKFDENEDIRAHLVGLDELMAMITTGEAANAALILSAQWLALKRESLSG